MLPSGHGPAATPIPETGARTLRPALLMPPLIQRLEPFISWALFAIACSLLLFYLGVTYRALMHSDATMKLLLGEEMLHARSLFPRDWNYVNDIWILFPSLIAAPLLTISAPSLWLHSLVDVIAAGFVLYSAWLAGRAVGLQGPLRLLPASVLACGLSTTFVEDVFGQSAYSAVTFTLLLLAGSCARQLAAPAGAPRRRDYWIVAILLLVSVASGPRGVASYAGPLLLALAGFHALSGQRPDEGRRARRLLGVVVTASFVGALAFVLLRRVLRYREGVISLGFAPHAQIPDHLRLVLANWLQMFDALPPDGGHFSLLLAATYAIRLALAATIFLLPIVLALRLQGLQSTALRFLVLFHLAITASTIYLLVFTGVYAEGTMTTRYLVPLLPTALLILGLWLQQLAAAWQFNAAHASWLVILAFLSLSPVQLVAPAFRHWPDLDSGLRDNRHAGLLAALQQAGLHRGFASYWNASVLDVLSGGDVRAAGVVFSPGSLPKPFRHLSADRWYGPDWAPGPTFLILGPSEADMINRPALDAALGSPERILHVDGFEVLVYPFDLASRFGWDQPPIRLPAMTPERCAAQFEIAEPFRSLGPGEFSTLQIRATNTSSITWSQNSITAFNPGLMIIDSTGRMVADPRGLLPHATLPGESVDIAMPFQAPRAPGDYTLQFSFVAEGDAWCGPLAANWGIAHLTVHP